MKTVETQVNETIKTFQDINAEFNKEKDSRKPKLEMKTLGCHTKLRVKPPL